MGFIKEYRKLFSQLNKALDEWEKLGVKPNAVRHAENLIERFYEWAGKSPKRNDRFNTRVKLTEEQQDELEEIAQSLVNTEIFSDDFYDESFIKAFNKVKGTYGINTIEEYKDYVDRKERYKNEKLIASVIGWYKYDKLAQRYSTRRKGGNLQEDNDKLNKIIIEAYNKTGFEGEQLYEFVYKNL